MTSRPVRLWAALAFAVLLSACNGSASTTSTIDGASSTTAAPETSSTSAAPTTTTVAPSTNPPDESVTLLVPTSGEMDGHWTETLFIPYGDSPDTLGTSPGGDGGTIDWGPDYGTQAADGTWWFLDAARMRIAHFDEDAAYLGEVVLTEDQLVSGQFFQFQMPQAMADGSIIASGLRSDGAQLLVLTDDQIRIIDVDAEVSLDRTDGERLFGTDATTGEVVAVDPSGEVWPVDWATSRGGTEYGFVAEGDRQRVDLPEVGVRRDLELRWEDDPTSVAFAGAEVEAGPDGTVHVYLYGAPAADESVQLAGYYSVSATGSVSSVERSRDPFSPSEPGSPAHLGLDPRTGTPWLMFVDADGVRVLSRTG